MTCYYNGELEILNGRTADETVQQIFRKRGLIGANKTGVAVRFIAKFVDINDMIAAEILDDLTVAVAELHAIGYRMEGSVTYYGDYDGAYEVKPDGTVEQYDTDDWAVHQYDDAGLIAEMERRGYTVAKVQNSDAPNVLVDVCGGMVQNVYANVPITVKVYDEDASETPEADDEEFNRLTALDEYKQVW